MAEPPRPVLLAAVFALALLLRLPRAVQRWDEVALAYAAYPAPTVEALARGDLPAALGTWMGLHPPLWPVLHALGELLLPVPLLALLASVLASSLAVLLVARVGGPLAGLVLATAPLQLAYAAEINNYPLAVALVAAALALSRGPWWALSLVTVFGAWTHILAGAAAGGLVLERAWVDRKQAPQLLLATTLGLLPVGVGALRRMGQAGTFDQPALDPGGWLEAAFAAVGLPGLALGLVALMGLDRRLLAALLPLLLTLGLALVAGAAAPHQQPYLLLLGPPLAVAAAQARRRLSSFARPLLVLILLACGVRGLVAVGEAGQGVAALVADQAQPRAIDAALAASVEGDLLWLVAPALQADDDKTAMAPVLWRLPPWAWMPMARRVPFEYRDFRYGQPRQWRGRTVHSSTELYAAPFDQVAAEALGRGVQIYVVLYEQGPATGLLQRVERVLQPYAAEAGRFPHPGGLGEDWLWPVTGRRVEASP